MICPLSVVSSQPGSAEFAVFELCGCFLKRAADFSGRRKSAYPLRPYQLRGVSDTAFLLTDRLLVLWKALPSTLQHQRAQKPGKSAHPSLPRHYCRPRRVSKSEYIEWLNSKAQLVARALDR